MMSSSGTSPARDKFELLVFSEAGKPIYSHSKREDAVTLMPLCSALINYASKTQKETLSSIRTSDNLSVNFTSRSPLIMIVICQADSTVDPQIVVDQAEAQIVSTLTAKSLRSVFQDRPTFDLKRLLYGSEKLIDSVVSIEPHEVRFTVPSIQAFLAVTSPTLQAAAAASSRASNTLANQTNSMLPPRPHRKLLPIVTMASQTRDTIHNILSNVIASNSKNVVFSLLFRIMLSADDEHEIIVDEQASNSSSTDQHNELSHKLITVCNHHPKHKIRIADIHLILALLNGSRAQLCSVESMWMPVCLPRFNQDAFLHSYISYVNEMKHCLVILSVDREEFPNCQRARDTIESKLASLLNDSNQRDKIYYQLSPLVHPAILELQERLANTSLSGEETAEAQQKIQIYNSKAELYHARQLQFLWYQTSTQVLWWQRSPSRGMSKVMYYVTRKMLQSSLKTMWLKLSDNTTFIGWHVPTFQLYAQFDGSITTNEATEVIQRITSWIKKEEDNFTLKDHQ